MGTINYGTSKYITVGMKPYDYDDLRKIVFECGSDYRKEEDVSDEAIADQNEYETNCEKEICQDILDKYSFDYFDLELKSGYYEGFYLDIESKFEEELYSKEDMSRAMSEAIVLKKVLYDIIDNSKDMCVCHPGWCTAYLNAEDSKKEIDEAIDKIIDDINKEGDSMLENIEFQV